MSLEKINGEKVDEIMQILDEAGKQGRGKEVDKEKIINFKYFFNKALDLRCELEKEEEMMYCKEHYKTMYDKFNEVIEDFIKKCS